jgi:uncharacterized protein
MRSRHCRGAASNAAPSRTCVAKREGVGVSTATAVGLTLVALAGNLLANVVAHAHLAAGLALVACLTAISAAARLTASDLGLACSTWTRGLRLGAAGAVVVAVGYVFVSVLPRIRGAVLGPVDTTWQATLVAALVLIPLGTVLPEELAFRGVLWSLLTRVRGEHAATIMSSGLFGIWHVLPALGGGPLNQALKEDFGSDTTGTVLVVIGTTIFTAIAGVLLCELRRRSDSLFAPILLHWAVNGLGTIFVMVV